MDELVSLSVGLRVGPTPHETPRRPLYRARHIRYPHTNERTNHVANIKSQIKRIRQNEKRRLRNKSVKSALKTAIRKFHAALESGDRELATTLARDASRKLDKAVSKGVIHKNQAANKKSAIAKKLQAVTSQSSEG